jgi:hypothetical protein
MLHPLRAQEIMKQLIIFTRRSLQLFQVNSFQKYIQSNVLLLYFLYQSLSIETITIVAV